MQLCPAHHNADSHSMYGSKLGRYPSDGGSPPSPICNRNDAEAAEQLLTDNGMTLQEVQAGVRGVWYVRGETGQAGASHKVVSRSLGSPV